MTNALATSPSSARVAALAVATLAVYAIEVALAHRIPSRSVLAAVVVDLVVVVPLAWWLFAVRGTRRAARRMITIALASVTGTALVVPQVGLLLRGLAAPVEIAVVAASALAVRRALRASKATDVAEAWERSLVATFGDHAVSRLLAAEMSALHYATFAFRRVAVATPGATFTLAQARSPALTWGLVLVTAVESAVTHALVGAAHPALAWTLTALGAYAMLWLVGQDRALLARVIDVEPDALVLRAGLRLTARVPWSSVGGAEIVSWSSPPIARAGYLDVARPVEPNVVVTFREPIEVTASFGVRRRVTAVGVCVDEPDALRDAIARARKR